VAVCTAPLQLQVVCKTAFSMTGPACTLADELRGATVSQNSIAHVRAVCIELVLKGAEQSVLQVRTSGWDVPTAERACSQAQGCGAAFAQYSIATAC
jgi:hypothetical protein